MEMQIRVETDNHVQGDERLAEYVDGVVRGAVDRFAEHVTVIAAHLGDVNSREKAGSDDMRCVLEAHVAGMKNIAVTHHAESLQAAVEGAADKLEKAMESSLGKVQDRQRRQPGTGHLSADVVRGQDDLPPTP
jgi:ribosome-associated translation inhibitor RaiA